MVSQIFTTQNTEETRRLAGQIGKDLKSLPASWRGGKILALYGELGSGKTTFVQGLARGLGIKRRILSPTFILVRSYPLKDSELPTLYHIDLYRLHSTKEARSLGLEEIWRNPQNICAIEWAEKIKEILPKERWEIHFEYENESKRRITIFRRS